MKKKVKSTKSTARSTRPKARSKRIEDSMDVTELRDIAHTHRRSAESQLRLYRIGFWLLFMLVIFSVTFGVWAISSIYANFQVVTNILDESFERTNLVLDITSSRISSCEMQVKECQSSGRSQSEVGLSSG